MPLRFADEVCEHLRDLPGMPRFRKEWPVAERDRALAASVAFLTQYGERFRESAASRALRGKDPFAQRDLPAILAFEPLGHPATPDDVKAGRAIFSFGTTSVPVRRVPMPAFPLVARWTKLEILPDEQAEMRALDWANYQLANRTEHLQTGRVWQAEESQTGGRWHRFYGFVCDHAVMRVAAEEIVFVTPRREGWSLISTDLDARITAQEAATTGPVPVELLFRNHRGVESTAPGDLVRGAGAAMSIREGISFRLIRVSDKPVGYDAFLARIRGLPDNPFPPEEIAARPLARHSRGAKGQTVSPAGTAAALQLELRTLFPIEQPGRYRLEISFDDFKLDSGSNGKVETYFPVVVRKIE